MARGFALALVIGSAPRDGDAPVGDPVARTRGGIAGAAIGFLAAGPDGRRVEQTAARRARSMVQRGAAKPFEA
jgi:hypothetical protein